MTNCLVAIDHLFNQANYTHCLHLFHDGVECVYPDHGLANHDIQMSPAAVFHQSPSFPSRRLRPAHGSFETW